MAGIVGRADLIACSFYITTILLYIRHVQWREKCDLRHWLALSGAFLCASIAVLCKETAVSALMVCAIYDVLKGYNTFSKDKVSVPADMKMKSLFDTIPALNSSFSCATTIR